MAILIVFAHPLEAKLTISSTGAKQIDDHLYAFERGKILICGMGTLAAATQTLHHGRGMDEIVNLGIAGSLRDEIEVGQTYTIQTVDKYLSMDADAHTTRLAKKSHPPMTVNTEGKKLLSSDYPIWDDELRGQLGKTHDIVDMEGYGVAKAAEVLGIPCRITKLISDRASTQGHRNLSNCFDTCWEV